MVFKPLTSFAGMGDFIGKPIDPVALYSMILRWLDKDPSGDVQS